MKLIRLRVCLLAQLIEYLKFFVHNAQFISETQQVEAKTYTFLLYLGCSEMQYDNENGLNLFIYQS